MDLCDNCGKPADERIDVVTEAGDSGDRYCPPSRPTIEAWCPVCVKAGGYLAKVDENPRQRGDDDGFEYADPRDEVL